MILLADSGGIAATNCFVIGDERSGQAVLFDAPDGTVGPLLNELTRRHLDLVGLWLTHGHFDHIADHAAVIGRFPKAQVLIHELDAPKLRDPSPQLQLFDLPLEIRGREPDRLVRGGETLAIGGLRVEVLHTPGHSPGHVMYHLPREHVLIGGDLIIGGAVGRTDLPDADHATLEESIRRVMQLPPQTALLPGHGQATTLAHERQTNAYVREALGE
jgi:glyoxylase-like metal-dependent hydrolase (beta-lactamase superfamily II)